MRKNIILPVLIITLVGCSSPPNEKFIDTEVFTETNKPFLSTYQTSHTAISMAKLDNSNDQVELIENSEYVIWINEFKPNNNAISKKKIPLNAEVAEINVPPFDHSDCLDGCGKPRVEKAVIKVIQECTEKGC